LRTIHAEELGRLRCRRSVRPDPGAVEDGFVGGDGIRGGGLRGSDIVAVGVTFASSRGTECAMTGLMLMSTFSSDRGVGGVESFRVDVEIPGVIYVFLVSRFLRNEVNDELVEDEDEDGLPVVVDSVSGVSDGCDIAVSGRLIGSSGGNSSI